MVLKVGVLIWVISYNTLNVANGWSINENGVIILEILMGNEKLIWVIGWNINVTIIIIDEVVSLIFNKLNIIKYFWNSR